MARKIAHRRRATEPKKTRVGVHGPRRPSLATLSRRSDIVSIFITFHRSYPTYLDSHPPNRQRLFSVALPHRDLLIQTTISPNEIDFHIVPALSIAKIWRRGSERNRARFCLFVSGRSRWRPPERPDASLCQITLTLCTRFVSHGSRLFSNASRRFVQKHSMAKIVILVFACFIFTPD
jgi:hypothetical protein